MKLLNTTFFLLLLTFSTACGCIPHNIPPAIADEPRTVEIGIVCRRQFSTDMYRESMYRHVDAMLSGGRIISFHNSHERPDGIKAKMTRTWKGIIVRRPWMIKNRLRYVNKDAARLYERDGNRVPVVSVWARWKVSPKRAKLLDEAWGRLEKDPPNFRLLGSNCATVAARALYEAGILQPGIYGIPGIDRPGTLLQTILDQYGSEVTVQTGFFGYEGKTPTIDPLPPRPSSTEEIDLSGARLYNQTTQDVQ